MNRIEKCGIVLMLLIATFAAGLEINLLTSKKPEPMVLEATPETIVVPAYKLEEAATIPTEPPTEATIAETEPELTYLGRFCLTAYCPCEKCCGEHALHRPKDENGKDIVYTGSGARAYPNHTIAVDTNIIGIGTKVMINGIEYTAEDTGGFEGYVIDIYFETHEEACAFGTKVAEVWRVEA